MTRAQKAPFATEMRELKRDNLRLQAILGEFLDVEEAMALGNYPLADHRGPARLNKILADYMRWGGSYPEVTRADLRRIKRARKALGLPAWWELP